MSKSGNHYAQVQLTVTLIRPRRADAPSYVDWRLAAKAPEEDWTLRHTVAFGHDAAAVSYPPSKDDMLALMVEVLLGLGADGSPPF